MSKKKNFLKKLNIPKNRRKHVDYDYLNELNEEELEFLEKFNAEYYGADLKINDTYIKENGEYVQVSGNENESDNRDLRKLRKVKKYYKDENGEMTEDINYKYNKDNLHNTGKLRKDCNARANSVDRDLFNKMEGFHLIEDYEYELLSDNKKMDYEPSPENSLINQEDIFNLFHLLTDEEQREITNPNFKKKRGRKKKKKN